MRNPKDAHAALERALATCEKPPAAHPDRSVVGILLTYPAGVALVGRAKANVVTQGILLGRVDAIRQSLKGCMDEADLLSVTELLDEAEKEHGDALTTYFPTFLGGCNDFVTDHHEKLAVTVATDFLQLFNPPGGGTRDPLYTTLHTCFIS